MALSGHAIQLTLRPKARGSHRPPLFPPLKPWRPELQAFKRRGMMKNIPLRLVTSAAISSGFGTGNVGSDSSLLQTIKAFYYSINTKDSKSLKVLLSEDCFFDDFSFPAPFQGKKESLYFLEQLTTCMGQNMEFSIDHICEGVDQTAVVNWHLEWKKKQVPFTRGCSYYELSREGERLVIKKAQVIIESPVKPGGLALTMFKAITSLFDAFPDATETVTKYIQDGFRAYAKPGCLVVHQTHETYCYLSQPRVQGSAIHCKDFQQVKDDTHRGARNIYLIYLSLSHIKIQTFRGFSTYIWPSLPTRSTFKIAFHT
ncbi:PREDICTED: uncharacterized protein LOC109147681 isoform X1 [Ipomoea nil]|uniref:uncharacterized protein LOC109147681 isoform X1 n=1 Tax=Ipomoea nil TaxID=35883 RepID=UPI000901F7A4|nr:PREDICTED: uncharacterized protein LOC109147681 isoform X1 [Ipomoea nil]